MPEQTHPGAPRSWWRFAIVSLVGAAVFTLSSTPDRVAATDGNLTGPAPSPTRSGPPKGAGEPLLVETTGRLLVRYRSDVTPTERGAVRAAEGVSLVESVALPDTELVEPTGGNTIQAMARLEGHPDVEWVEPDQRASLMGAPSAEPRYAEQWALNNTGQTVGGFVGAVDVDMNAPEAWGITTGSPSVVIAVIDDGVDFSHPDLADRMWVNPGEIAGNGLDDDSNGYVDDINGWDFCNGDASVQDAGDFHGTHISGSIAGSSNGSGITGVAPSARIMALKVIDDDPSCSTVALAVEAIAYARAHGARIINASWGIYGFSQALYDAIALTPGALVVAAAGNENNNNDGPNSVYPASFDLPNVLSIASIHNEGGLTASTNFGATTVDLSAPGEEILSTMPGGDWLSLSGTSMAAANASGVAALAASVKTSLTDGGQLRQHLISTARALPSTRGWVASPRLLDARAAVVDRPDIRRLAGGDRYATAAAISAATFTPRTPLLFVATGRGFPDALAGGAVAAQVGAPLLLVSTSSIPAVTLAEIQRLQPLHIYVLGGAGVVTDAVVSQLSQYDHPSSPGPFRLAGANRYETAAAISQAAFDPDIAPVPTAFIATGTNFPDALAGVPASAIRGGPLLLATRDSIPAATANELAALRPGQIVILGGTGVISPGVAAQLQNYTTGPVSRMAGADRFATAAAVAADTFAASETAFLANGLNFPDALAGGPSGGAFGGPLLLVTASMAPTPTTQQLQRLQPARIFVLGGTGVVSDAVITQVDALFP